MTVFKLHFVTRQKLANLSQQAKVVFFMFLAIEVISSTKLEISYGASSLPIMREIVTYESLFTMMLTRFILMVVLTAS